MSNLFSDKEVTLIKDIQSKIKYLINKNWHLVPASQNSKCYCAPEDISYSNPMTLDDAVEAQIIIDKK